MDPLLGIDVGTTTISIVVIDSADGRNLYSHSLPHQAELPPDVPGAHLQSPEQLLSTVVAAMDQVAASYPTLSGIGITGQMHGIVPIDDGGNAVGPAYTWLDGRLANTNGSGTSYREELWERHGVGVPVGYGAGTLYTLVQSGAIDARVTSVVDIPSWIALQLTGRTRGCTAAGLAHSLGLYSIAEQDFLAEQWERLGIAPPCVAGGLEILGETRSGTPVVTPEGDNQCSFLATVRDPDRAIAFNIGTSGQVSFVDFAGDADDRGSALEARPYPGDGLLLVGASLSGGKSFEILASLVDQIARLSGATKTDPYALFEQLARPDHPLGVDPRFAGSRIDPNSRGAISSIALDNFTLEHLYWGFAAGVVRELVDMLGPHRKILKRPESYVTISGNALERSTAAQTILGEEIGRPLCQPTETEVAARGAAMLAAATLEGGTDKLPDVQRRMIRYR